MSRPRLTPQQIHAHFGMDKRGRKARMQRMGDAIVGEWSASARQFGDMNSTLGPYQRAIAIRKVTANSVIVELPGSKIEKSGKGRGVAMIARMMEFGLGPGGIGSSGPFDVRQNLLSGAKYKNVPFKHSAKSITDLGGQSALDDAKSLKATRVKGGSWNGPSLEAGYTKIVNNPLTKKPHKTDKLAQMRRMGKKGKTSRFITFRRASWKGKPWMHPGIRARGISKIVNGELLRLWSEVG